MSFPVVVSEQAEVDLDDINNYIEAEFGERASRKFLLKVRLALSRLSILPLSNPESRAKSGLRRCIIRPYTILYYRFVNGVVLVDAILDGRVNPDRLPG